MLITATVVGSKFVVNKYDLCSVTDLDETSWQADIGCHTSCDLPNQAADPYPNLVTSLNSPAVDPYPNLVTSLNFPAADPYPNLVTSLNSPVVPPHVS